MGESISPIIKLFLIIILIYFFSFLYGILYYFILIIISIKIIEKGFNLEFIKGEDLIFTVEYDKSPNTIFASVTIDKIKFEEFKMIFIEKILQNFPRMNQSIRFKFFEYFWETHPIDISLKNIKKLRLFSSKYTANEDNMEDFGHIRQSEKIKLFIERKFSSHLVFNKPMWRIYYDENYEDDKSLFIVKFHHSLGDGSALLNILSSLSVENKIKNEYNNIKNKNYIRLDFIKKILMYLYYPIAIFKISPKNQKKNFVNPLNQHIQLPIGINSIGKSNEIHLYIIRNKIRLINQCSNLHVTINDFLVYIINKSITNYLGFEQGRNDSLGKFDSNYKMTEKENKENFVSNDYEESNYKKNQENNKICAVIALSYRFELEEHELGNKSAGIVIEYDFNINFSIEEENNEIIKISKMNQILKRKFTFASAFKIGSFILSLMINKKLFIKFGEKAFKNVSYIFTNVRGIDTQTDINGKKIHHIGCYVPHGALILSFLAITYNNTISLTINTDKGSNLDTLVLIKYINDNLKNFIEN